jgi:MFS family permease
VRSALGALQEPQFRRLFFGRSISLLGSAFAPVALAFAVIDDLDGAAAQLGLVLAAIWVPQVIFILIGGVWADRLPRNVVMVGTDLVMAGSQAAVALLLLTDRAEIWHLVALQVVRGIANAFFFPASTGLVPSVVSPERLQQANALLRLTQSGSNIVGAGLAGLIVAAAGSGWALAFDSLTFLASAA